MRNLLRMYPQHFIAVARIYATHRRITMATLGTYLVRDAKLFDRCATGRITLKRLWIAISRLVERWPDDLAWPTDIPRPAPTPDGGSEPPAGGADPSSPVRTPAREAAGVPARGSLSAASTGPAGGGESNPPERTTASRDGTSSLAPMPAGGAAARLGRLPSAPPAASLKRAETSRPSGSVTARSADGAVHPVDAPPQDDLGSGNYAWISAAGDAKSDA